MEPTATPGGGTLRHTLKKFLMKLIISKSILIKKSIFNRIIKINF